MNGRFHEMSVSEREAVAKTAVPNFDDIFTRERVAKLWADYYVGRGMGVAAIARQCDMLGVSRHTIARYFGRYGLPTRQDANYQQMVQACGLSEPKRGYLVMQTETRRETTFGDGLSEETQALLARYPQGAIKAAEAHRKSGLNKAKSLSNIFSAGVVDEWIALLGQGMSCAWIARHNGLYKTSKSVIRRYVVARQQELQADRPETPIDAQPETAVTQQPEQAVARPLNQQLATAARLIEQLNGIDGVKASGSFVLKLEISGEF